MCVCVFVCVRACMRACVGARACVRVGGGGGGCFVFANRTRNRVKNCYCKLFFFKIRSFGLGL